MDYDGAMGVPITFLDKYNPDQFEIMGSSLQWLSRCRSSPSEGHYGGGGHGNASTCQSGDGTLSPPVRADRHPPDRSGTA